MAGIYTVVLPDLAREGIVVEAFADGLLVGGMTYAIDPTLRRRRRAAGHG